MKTKKNPRLVGLNIDIPVTIEKFLIKEDTNLNQYLEAQKNQFGIVSVSCAEKKGVHKCFTKNQFSYFF